MHRHFIVLLPLGLSLLLPACARKGATESAGPARATKQAVEVTPLARRDMAETLVVVGSLAANESAEIRPEVAGQVKQIFFEEGQRVTKGQLLLKIDDSELLAQVSQSEARYRLAELNLARSQNLVESRTVSQADNDRAKAEFAAGSAELALIRVRLQKTEIKAPFDGIVGSRSISPGDYVNTQTVITVINDLSQMKIDFQVPERFIGKVRQGTTFNLKAKSVDASERVQGEVYFVSSVIERSTRSSEVKGLLAKPPAGLKPGMFANVELVLDVRQKVLTVPEGAVFVTQKGSQIILAKTVGSDVVAEMVPVNLGLRAKGFVEIQPAKEGFDEKQPVVAAGVGALSLYSGVKLDPRPLKQEFKLAE